MELSVQLFDKICRICLVQSANLKSLLTKTEDDDRNLLEMLGFTANIDIKIEDSLPKQLCGSCESMMCQAHAFKRRCHESERILNNVYQNTVGAAELSQGTENFSIKDEKIGLKEKLSEYGTFMSHVSSNSGVKDVFSKKNQLESDAQVCSTDLSFNKLTIPELPVSYDVPVKEETVDNIDDGEYLNDFDNRDQFESGTLETVEKTNVKPKPKGKKLGVRYECYCHAQFTNKVKYKTHLKEKKCDAYKVLKFNKGKTIKNEIQCKKCQAMFTTVYSWKQHQLIHSDENTTVNDNIELFQCTFCLRKFKNQTSLSAHMQRHEETDNIKHVCEICKREFKYKAYLENHLLTAHSRTTKTNGFTCDICVQSFLNKKDLETHKKSHETDKKHCCTVCSKGFYMLCTLKEHMRTHTGEKPFLCSQCGKGFSQKTNLAQHMRRHQGLKPFKCETCEKRFVSKGELDAHTRKHSGAHPFVCDDCGNGFTTSSALVKHRRTHTGERPYQCDLCPMRFAASGTLKNHRRTHTGERPFQCSYCEKAFVQRNDLISHIRCHTGERPYICTQCGQAFRKASGLKTHLKLHIKDPVIGVNKALVAAMHLAEQ